MSESLTRKLSQNNPMYSSSHEIEQGLYGCQNYSVQQKVQNVGMKKGQGLRLLKLPKHLHCLENVWHNNKMYFTEGPLP